MAIVAQETKGQGADVFLECSGSPAAARVGLLATRRGGQYTQVGLFGQPFALDFAQVAYRELKVTGSLGSKWTSWARGLELMKRRKVDTKAVVSDILPLSAWREAFRLFEARQCLKIVLQPGD